MGFDPGQGGTEVVTEVQAVGDAGEPTLILNASSVLVGAVTQQAFYDGVDAAVAAALRASGVTLGPGRTVVVCGRVV